MRNPPKVYRSAPHCAVCGDQLVRQSWESARGYHNRELCGGACKRAVRHTPAECAHVRWQGVSKEWQR